MSSNMTPWLGDNIDKELFIKLDGELARVATLDKRGNNYHLMSDYDNFWLSLLSREFSAETPEEALKKSYGLVAAFMRRYAKQIIRLASQLDGYKKEM